MKKILYHDSYTFERRKETLSKGMEAIQSVLNELAGMNLPVKIESMKSVLKLIEEGETFVKSEIAKKLEPTTILGIPLSRAKLVQQMDLPDFAKLNGLATASREYQNCFSFYSLKGNRIEFNESKLEELKDAYSSIAITKDQLTMIEFHTKAAEMLTEFNKALKKAMGNAVELQGDNELRQYFEIKDGAVAVKDYFYMLNKGILMDVQERK